MVATYQDQIHERQATQAVVFGPHQPYPPGFWGLIRLVRAEGLVSTPTVDRDLAGQRPARGAHEGGHVDDVVV